jgi:hypothetical protein
VDCLTSRSREALNLNDGNKTHQKQQQQQITNN